MSVSFPGYRIVSDLYESRNSRIYRAIRLADTQPVIIKQLKDDYPAPEELTRYRQEFEITRALNETGIIKVHDKVQTNQGLIMILEDAPGSRAVPGSGAGLG